MVAESGAPTPAILEVPIAGMTCNACVARIEEKLGALPGVEAKVDLSTGRATVRYLPPVTPDDVSAAIVAAGYRVPLESAPEPTPPVLTAVPERPRPAAVPVTLLSDAVASAGEALAIRQLRVALILGVPIVVLASVPGLRFAGWQWISLLLAAPVALWCALPFHRGAWRALTKGAATADTLVSLGVLLAFGWTASSLLFGGASGASDDLTAGWVPRHGDSAHVSLEVAAGVTAALLLGRHLEMRARRRAGAPLRRLLQLGVREVTLPDGSQVPVEQLDVGDVFVTGAGERFAADGVVVEGESSADLMLLTGETTQVVVRPGSQVTGASLNTGAQVSVRATRVGADTVLAHLARTVSQAQNFKGGAQQAADRVTGTFVSLVLVLAAATLGFWLGHGAPVSLAVESTVAVLVAACPWALSLAAPMALLVSAGRGAQLGILLRGPNAVENAAGLDTVLLDKTGTITEGRLVVRAVVPAPGVDADRVLQRAAVVERQADHAVADAVVDAAGDGPAMGAATRSAARLGRGVWADVDGEQVAVGRLSLAGRRTGSTSPPELDRAREEGENAGRSVVGVAWGAGVRGVLILEDPVRPSSPAALESLRSLGLRPVLLSRDAVRSGRAGRPAAGHPGHPSGREPGRRGGNREAPAGRRPRRGADRQRPGQPGGAESGRCQHRDGRHRRHRAVRRHCGDPAGSSPRGGRHSVEPADGERHAREPVLGVQLQLRCHAASCGRGAQPCRRGRAHRRSKPRCRAEQPAAPPFHVRREVTALGRDLVAPGNCRAACAIPPDTPICGGSPPGSSSIILVCRLGPA